jgi:hypothetical protein
MRTFVLIAILGAMGLSAFLWSGTAHGQVRPPEKLSPCAELRLEVESGTAGPVESWPQERILLGLLCAHLGANPFIGGPVGVVVEVAPAPLIVTAKPAGGD